MNEEVYACEDRC